MRNAIFCAVSAYALIVTGLLLKQLVAHAEPEGAGGVAMENGDVNGDSVVDISDAIYLLDYLFLGGPSVVPIECPPPIPTGLPATGQTRCWDASGNVIDCAISTCPGQDGFYMAGWPIEDRFVDNGDGTVDDLATGLTWQRDTAPGSYSWCDALHYCESLKLASHDDWRLPNVRELQNLLDFRQISPAIDPVFGAVADLYWTSTSSVNYAPYAWFVSFDNRLVSAHERYNSHPVRAVRGGR